MNMHVPQSYEAEAELITLAAVPYQIISPANNAPIIGIFQDSMLGCFQFTRPNVTFSKTEAMNLMINCSTIDKNLFYNLPEDQRITNFDLLSQIMPPLSMKLKNNLFKNDDAKTSNNVVEIINGKYVRGQIDKGILGKGSKGIIHRICNDYGNKAASKFIDELQSIITNYVKQTGFSVGISDLEIDTETNEKITNIISDKKNDVQQLINQIILNSFENNTGKSNREEFENQVNNILNKGISEAEKLAINNLEKDNRFAIMVNSGSKGSDINIRQMIVALGQQNVDGGRIPFDFDHRTLPHFTKYDESALARGFVEDSFIGGLSPGGLFFHAIGGRMGLIDTAVKTSSTGYIQRRLIKGLEDLIVKYDMTVRSNKNHIIQFIYGNDSIDSTKTETQHVSLASMTIQDIYEYYCIVFDSSEMNKTLSLIYNNDTLRRHKEQINELKEKNIALINFMIDSKKMLITQYWNNKKDDVIRCPVSISALIQNVIGQQQLNSNSMSDITMLEALNLIDSYYVNYLEANKYVKPNLLFKIVYYYYLSPKKLIIEQRFNRASLILLLNNILLQFNKSIVAPGETVGIIAGQSIGEPTTQMSIPYWEKVNYVKVNKVTKEITLISQQIGEFCDSIIQENPEYTFNTGHVNSVETLLDNLNDEYYIVGVNQQEKIHWNKISHVSKHPVNGNLLEITTKSGRTVTSTLSHSHLIRDEITQTVVPCRGDMLTIGMRIPVAKHIPNTFINNNVINYSIEISDDIDKINGLETILQKCNNILKLNDNKLLVAKFDIERTVLQKYIDIFESHENKELIHDELVILKQAANSDVIWDEVISIKNITPEHNEFVYDFTVPNTQTFMLSSGVIVHNTLNTFHFAGVASKSNVTRGVPRLEEILSVSSSISKPSLTIYLRESDQTNRQTAINIKNLLVHTTLESLIKQADIYLDPNIYQTNKLFPQDQVIINQYYAYTNMIQDCLSVEDKSHNLDMSPNISQFVVRLEIDSEKLLEKNITMNDIYFTLNNIYSDEISCVYSDYNNDNLVFRIRLTNIIKNASRGKRSGTTPLDTTDMNSVLKNFLDKIKKDVVLRGIKNISNVTPRPVNGYLVEKNGTFEPQDIWVLDTDGTNLANILTLDFIDPIRTISNDIVEVYKVLGIDAAKQCLAEELVNVFDGTYINPHHINLLCDRMTYTGSLISITRHGINNDDIGVLAKASFEETLEMLLRAARNGELDPVTGISANVMCGQDGPYGTTSFQVMMDMDKITELEEIEQKELESVESIIDKGLMDTSQNISMACSAQKLQFMNNVDNLKSTDFGSDYTDKYTIF